MIQATIDFTYQRQLPYRERIAIGIPIPLIGTKSWDFEYEIWSEAHRHRVALGITTMVAFDFSVNKPSKSRRVAQSDRRVRSRTSANLRVTPFALALFLYYAYNGGESERAFAAIAAAEPSNAMAFWGEALAAGPDLNTSMTSERFARGQAAIAKALAVEAGAKRTRSAR